MRSFRMAVAAGLLTTLFVSAAIAQTQVPAPPQAPAPPKPYKPVSISAPVPLTDPSFEAFRKQVQDIAKRKDKAALGKIVAKNFFWERESGNGADKKKTGADNLATALDLNAPDGSGWDVLGIYTSDPTAEPMQGRTGVVCGPAGPKYDEKALEALTQSSDTDVSEWAYPAKPSVEAHASADSSSPVVDKLGMNFVRVYPDDSPANAITAPNAIRVVLPSGKTGYVAMESLAPLTADQLCYVKDASGWKIAGYVGSSDQQ